MGAFAATGNVSQSQDGKTLTFHDTSPYGDNDENLDITDFTSRTVIVYDADVNVLGTIDLGATNLTGTFQITKDGPYRLQPTLVSNEPHTYLSEVDYLSKQFYYLAQKNYVKLITCGDCCQSKASDYASDALECVYSADNNLLVNDLVSAQSDMDAATTFINNALK